MTKELGDTVVGWQKPGRCLGSALGLASRRLEGEPTLQLGLAVDLGDLLLQELVALLADGDNLLAGDAELGYLGQDLLGDGAGRLVLVDGGRVAQRVICKARPLALMPRRRAPVPSRVRNAGVLRNGGVVVLHRCRHTGSTQAAVPASLVAGTSR